MNTTSIVDNWLSQLAARAGLDGLALDAQGRAALRYHDDLELLIELPEGSPVLQLYAPLRRLPADAAAQLPMLRHLLAMNLFALETRGATFALDAPGERVLLQVQIPLAGTDAAQFERIFGNFAEAALHWQQAPALREAPSAQDEAAPAAPADSFLLRV